MSQYFSILRIKTAINHLSAYDSKWVIPPFVFACNMVDSGRDYHDLNRGVGTDPFLKKFFSGELIGLPKKGDGDSLRPIFSDIGTLRAAAGVLPANADYVLHQKVKLWGSAYSRNGYREMIERGQLLKQPGSAASYKLDPSFRPAFEVALPATFCFEELLVWLFAFKEIPDAVNSWASLWEHYKNAYLNGQALPDDYSGRFALANPAPPWPADFTRERPSDLDYQRALLPSQFVDPIGQATWQLMQEKLIELVNANYEGISPQQTTAICRSIISGLAGTKRVFLLGDPGTGKTKLAELVRLAFESVIEPDRLLILSTDITDKTTESTLTGFVGLDGNWVFGSLTAPRGNKKLLNLKSDVANAAIRNQVNLITLDEANRKDIESILARFQTSLDSSSRDPLNEAHTVALGRSGDHLISPFTYLLMTGNSPKDDDGRAEQSRPFRRRPALVPVPNPLSAWLISCTDAEFLTRVVALWTRIAVDSQANTLLMREQITNAINNSAQVLTVLRQILIVMDRYRLGVSYGLLRKIILLAANEIAFGEVAYPTALDGALETGLTATLSSSTVIEDHSLRYALLALNPQLTTSFPRFANVVTNVLGDLSEFGTVDPHF